MAAHGRDWPDGGLIAVSMHTVELTTAEHTSAAMGEWQKGNEEGRRYGYCGHFTC
jgi:hypothetical protein